MKPKQISCLGYFGYHNTGDEAILSVLIDQLNRIGLIDRFVVFSGDVEFTERIHGTKAVQNILPTSTMKLATGILGRNRRNFVKSLRTFLASELIIIGGGGLFFDHPQSNEYLLQLLNKIRWGKRLGKKVALLGVGVGPIHCDDTPRALKQALEKVDLICVREERSKSLLLKVGLTKSTVNVTEDFAFLLDQAPEQKIQEIFDIEKLSVAQHEPMIGVGLCGRHVQEDEFRKTIVKFCNHMIQALDARICFIPMQTSGGFDDRHDIKLIPDAVDRKEKITLINREYGPKEILGIISRMDLVLGERFHAALFAAISGVPVVGISYMPKVRRLFRKIDQDKWCLDHDGLNGDELTTVFERLWNTRNEVSAELKKRIPQLIKQSQSNFEILEKYLKKKD